MTTQNDQPLGLIDVCAIEYEARAARAEVMRDAAVAVPAFVVRFVARLRAKQQTRGEAQAKAFA